MVELTGPDWRSGPVLPARSSGPRWRGLRPRSRGRGLLLRARSVHTWGMVETLGVASLDAAGRVRRVAVVLPGRLFVDRGAAWIVELPPGRPLPPTGERLLVWRRRTLPILGACPEP